MTALECPSAKLQPVKSRPADRPERPTSQPDRQERQLHELDRHNQQLLVESADVRREFMKKLDISSLEAFTKTVEPYREYFRRTR